VRASIGAIADDDVVNALESQSDLSISGTTTGVEDGQHVTVSLNGHDYDGVVTGNAWTVTVPQGDVAALADGGSYPVTADVSSVRWTGSLARIAAYCGYGSAVKPGSKGL